MKTVFDMVGKFARVLVNAQTGKQVIQKHEIVLCANMEPTQCACGEKVLNYLATQYAQEHIVPGKFWFTDWELREKKVEEGGVQQRVA
jgi:hypothetical protein